ncbi:RNA polymerase sigma factor [Streptomyces sp. NPDC101194]|uniref:RNA polymerase sigma factor n=1 Tax=Streptomyces sp. NPDC101194 TaxID=3366127 RepID=UPI0038188C4F
MSEGRQAAADVVSAMYLEKKPELLGHARRCLAKESIPESRLSAEDVVQDAFVVTLANHEKTPIRNLAGYAYKVISGRVRDESRRVGVARPFDPMQFIRVSEVVSEDVDGRLDVMNGLASLSPQQRRLVMLAKGYGFTHAQLAEMTGLGRGTVASHVARATRTLASLLAAVSATIVCGGLLGWLAFHGSSRLAPLGNAGAKIFEAIENYRFALMWLLVPVGGAIVLLSVMAYRRRQTEPIQYAGGLTPSRIAELMRVANYRGGPLEHIRGGPTPADYAEVLKISEELVMSGFDQAVIEAHDYPIMGLSPVPMRFDESQAEAEGASGSWRRRGAANSVPPSADNR